MGTSTPIRGLYKPLKNEVGWDQLVNGNFDNLDSTANTSYVDSSVGAEATTRANADSAEATTRANADTNLQNAINGKQATLTGVGLARNTGASTELSGDATTNGSNVVTVGKINGSAPAAIATSGKWSDLQNGTAALTLANGANGTEFDQTSAALWKWFNTTIATNGTTNGSPILNLSANYWTGAASAEDKWTLQATLAAGTNGASTLTFAHSGSTGLAIVSMPRTMLTGSGYHWYHGGNLPSDIYSNGEGTSDAVGIAGGLVYLASGGRLGWSSSAGNLNQAVGGVDSGISRLGAASLAVGNGTAGDFSGALTLGTLSQTNPTAATSSTTNTSPSHIFSATYWTGSASAADTWTVSSSLAAGTNGNSVLTFAHAGSTGGATVNAPAFGVTNSLAGLPPAGSPSGLYNAGGAPMTFNNGGTYSLLVADAVRGSVAGFIANALNLPSGGVFGFSGGSTSVNTHDTGISRLGVAALALGNGTSGDFSASLKYTGENNQGGQIVKRVSKAANYTSTAADFIIVFTATATLTLDSAAAVAGTMYRVKLSTAAAGGSALTISPNNSKTIEGVATETISTLGGSVDLVYDGVSNWEVF
jgi:hypothetical protein